MSPLDHPLHPLTVHFPIAFYILGVALTFAYLWRGEGDYERFAYWCLLLALLMGIISSLAGIIDQNQLDLADPRRANVDTHITAGVAMLIINGLVIYMRFRWADVLHRYRAAYLGLLGLGLIILLITAWLGGELVYGLGVGVR